MSVTPVSATLPEGDSVDLAATASLSNGSTAARTAGWASSAPAVATVSSAGRVSAVGAGGATITATIDGKSASATITVNRRVATVTLSVTARSMLLGDTLTLVATPRYSDATVAAGKAATWASTAPTVATVSAAGLVTAVAAGVATISATVDGRVASAAITVRPPAQTTLDASARTVASIDAAGGTLTATSNGVTYRLEVPAGALAVRTQITMTPVTAVANLALSGGAVGAVDLQPSGLTFARPARLRIGVAAPPRAGFSLTGFSIADAGGRTSREFAGAGPNEVVVLVTHFSTQGAGFGTTAEVQSLSTTIISSTPAADAARQAFLSAVGATPRNAATIMTTLTQWFDVGVLPLLQAAGGDQALIVAVADFERWASDVFVAVPGLPIDLNDPALSSRRAQWRTALVPKLSAAIDGNNTTCRNQQSESAMLNVLFWQSRAQYYGVDTGALNRTTVLQGLCAQLVVKSVSFPNPVQTNFAADLDVDFALQFGTNQTLVPKPVTVTFSSQGATFARTSPGNSDAQGFFTVAVTAQGNSLFTVSLTACLAIAGATDVCVSRVVNGSSLDMSGNYTGRFSSTITTPGGVIFPVNVPINVSLTQTQNGITGTYGVLLFNGPRGSVSAISFQLQLLNFTLNQFAPCPGVLSGQATFNVTTRAMTASYAGADCQGTHTNGATTLQPGTNRTRLFSGAWGATVNGVLTDVYKVRQTGTTVDVSHARRVQSGAGTQLECRAFYRGTVDINDFLTANFRAPGGGNITPPPANAVLQFSPNLTIVRAADVLHANDPVLFGGTSTLLVNPPAGCEP